MREMCLEVEERALVTTWASHLYVQPPLLYFPGSATVFMYASIIKPSL